MIFVCLNAVFGQTLFRPIIRSILRVSAIFFSGICLSAVCPTTKYARVKIIREGFVVFPNTSEDVSHLTANEFISDLSNNGFIIVVPQKIISKKT